jgi:hypothetical protein
LFRDRPPRPAPPSIADELEALANFHADQERRDCWRHAAGLDGNGHGQIEPGDLS